MTLSCFHCWRPPSRRSSLECCDMETGPQPPAEQSRAELSSRAALEPCWDLPDPQISLPGASARSRCELQSALPSHTF
ncbi:hypothetical protein JOB18_009912 [Solea senegalensis]|uniref:Uncharacterized protein n=1 Tax=Solea senegalensis TaxID=28829 RepID=A0AAV6QAG4_SOLSE|nr:hypothetical protein JOB18_009912 [Solea senegalensis]KAG7485409.1 hypothetical protein JOB18_009912 [Solea senegalensis]KAG7485410.1 hypothetical protein JOB18_009912 [Solea senegalensis]KAG7485411.1 hypothetical protein JOB18_009912 [Solea senegalensis]KAG7485412.1 hypothetical protein JOB18_009912 [Solea senegalensis]